MKFPISLKTVKNRILLILFLLCLLVGLGFYYNANYAENSKYPSSKTILNDYPQGEIVYISGDFAGNYNGGFFIEDDFNGKKVTYKVNSTYYASKGDIFSVTGILGPSFTIYPQKMVVNRQWKEDFLLYRSALVGIILFLIFWRYWKFDSKKFLFMRKR